MATLCSRCEHYIFVLFLLLSFFLVFSSPDLSGRRLDVYHTSAHGVALVRICMLEMCRTQFAGNTGRKNYAEIRRSIIAQLCRAASSQLRHVSTIEKKLFKQQYPLHTSS